MFQKDKSNEDVMPRQESALWIGRSMSTNEMLLRTLLQVMDIVRIQQQVLQVYHQGLEVEAKDEQGAEALAKMDEGLTKDLRTKLNDLREQLSPMVEMVDQSCQELEGML